MFIRTKKRKGRNYFYLCEHRKGKQKVLKYLGRKIPDNLLFLWNRRKRSKKKTIKEALLDNR